MHSWRVLILPFLDQNELYGSYRFDEPWNGPNNSKLHDVIVDVFRCPEDHGRSKSNQTSYVAVVGPETIWPGDHGVRVDEVAWDRRCSLSRLPIREFIGRSRAT